MLRDFWNRHLRRTQTSNVEREAEREQMSPTERRFDEKSIDDIKADTLVGERLGGIQPEQRSDEDQPVP
ncbi:MAG: hypothetical protein LH654_12995 [Thermoleophilia bacterium]|nr:hypothetical protein [Thermoleophilia bacterium]